MQFQVVQKGKYDVIHFDGLGMLPYGLDIRNVPTVKLLLKQPDVPENGLFIDLGKEGATVLLFLKKHIVMVRKLHCVCRSQEEEDS